jgi:hypothetical protein
MWALGTCMRVCEALHYILLKGRYSETRKTHAAVGWVRMNYVHALDPHSTTSPYIPLNFRFLLLSLPLHLPLVFFLMAYAPGPHISEHWVSRTTLNPALARIETSQRVKLNSVHCLLLIANVQYIIFIHQPWMRWGPRQPSATWGKQHWHCYWNWVKCCSLNGCCNFTRIVLPLK